MDTGELNSKKREKGRSTEQFEISESDCVCTQESDDLCNTFWAFMVSPSLGTRLPARRGRGSLAQLHTESC